MCRRSGVAGEMAAHTWREKHVQIIIRRSLPAKSNWEGTLTLQFIDCESLTVDNSQEFRSSLSQVTGGLHMAMNFTSRLSVRSSQ